MLLIELIENDSNWRANLENIVELQFFRGEFSVGFELQKSLFVSSRTMGF